MGDDIIQQILVALARIEERIKAQTEQADHRHSNIKMIMDGFVPRRELDERFRLFDDQIRDLRGSRAKLIGWLVAAWLSGIGVVGSLIVKKF